MILSIVAIVVSFLAAAFTGWYAWETRRMRRENKVFADQQLAQTKIASNASEQSAKAAQESAKIAGEGMQISQRAYLGTTSIEFLSNIPSVNQALVVKVILKNVGNSPALNVRIAYKIDFQPDVQTVPLAYPDNRQPGFDIAPGVEVPLEHILPGTVTQEHVNAISNDSKRLYVFGWARYHDIFAKEHATKWCYEYSRFTPGRIFKLVPLYHKIEELKA